MSVSMLLTGAKAWSREGRTQRRGMKLIDTALQPGRLSQAGAALHSEGKGGTSLAAEIGTFPYSLVQRMPIKITTSH